MVENSRRSSEAWKSMSDDQKAGFVQKAKDLKEKYQVELEAWEKKVDKSGDINDLENKLASLKKRKKQIGNEVNAEQDGKEKKKESKKKS